LKIGVGPCEESAFSNAGRSKTALENADSSIEALVARISWVKLLPEHEDPLATPEQVRESDRLYPMVMRAKEALSLPLKIAF